MTHPLDGVLGKIERAEAHAAELMAALKPVLDPNLYRFAFELDSEPDYHDWHVLRVWGVPEVKREWSLIAGDCIHNLQSALDHLAYRLVELDGANPPGTVTYFPIKKAPSYEKGRKVKKYTEPEIVRADIRQLLEEVQPYNIVNRFGFDGFEPEQDWLWLIHRLDIIDKHRLMLFLACVPDPNDLMWAAHPALIEPPQLFTSVLKDGSPVARFKFSGGQKPVDFNPCPPIQITLSELETPWLDWWDFQNALGHMIGRVKEVVGSNGPLVKSGFRPLFP